MAFRIKIIALLLCVWFNSVSANSESLWDDIKTDSISSNSASLSLSLLPDKYRLLRLNETELKNTLGAGSISAQGILSVNADQKIQLPLPDGSFLLLNAIQSQIMAPELAAKYPQIKTYRIDSHLNKGVHGVLDVTEQGFHAMLFMRDGQRMFIDPRKGVNETLYISYFDKHYHPTEKQPQRCHVKGHQSHKNKQSLQTIAQRSGTSLKTYRLAAAATGEYTSFHKGISGALSGIVTTINRVNVIYERDLAVRLILIDKTDQLILTDTSTYSNTDGGAMLEQNQKQVDTIIGSANYDIGHVFSTGGGGVAYLGSVCDSSLKAGGVTGGSSPVGDSFDIDFVAHEIGHQFGGNHTFNGVVDNCSGSNRNASTAYEPGSGSTIMGYAGICGSDDLQQNSDALFHTKSIEEISTFVDSAGGNSCGTSTAISNQQPTSNAGSDYAIPANTPFELIGTATDADQGDVLSYSWEQVDAGKASNVNIDTSDNAIFRVFTPQAVPTRTFPALTDILNNSTTLGEKLPASARTLNFSLTARDGRGGVAMDEMVATVTSSTGFRITSHNTAQTIGINTIQVVTWDIAGTASAPINCSNVAISLTTDSGKTFTNVSGGNTANDGSENVTIPTGTSNSTTARFKIKCADNIFFDLSDADLSTGLFPPSPTALTPVISNTGANNTIDPGETVHITIPLTNPFSTVLTKVSGILSTSVQNTSIPVANSDYPDIQPNNQVNNTTAYQLKIPESHTCGSNFPITLNTAFSSETTKNKQFDFMLPVGTLEANKLSNSISQNIPDDSATGITSVINIADVGVIETPSLSIDVDITHAYSDEISISLISPKGTIVQLKGDDDSDFEENIVGNFPSNLTPVGNLSDFNGENFDGEWTLKVVDNLFGDTGTLNNWSLNYSNATCDTNTGTDSDNDTINDDVDNCPNTANTDQLNTDKDAQGNACDTDDDNDGLPDTWENKYNLNPLDATDAALDSDGDGTSNLQEYLNGTNPNISDSTSAIGILPIIYKVLLD